MFDLRAASVIAEEADASDLSRLDGLSARLLTFDGRRQCVEALLDFLVPHDTSEALLTIADVNGVHRVAGFRTASGDPVGRVSERWHSISLDHKAVSMTLYVASGSIQKTAREGIERARRAIVEAELFERERRVALAFQQGALASTLPRLDGCRMSAVYETGRAEALVGGDWYDAFVLRDGRLVVSIGDVVGSGLGAAVMMVNVRQTIRSLAQVHADPRLILEAANLALLSQHEGAFVTTFVAVIELATQHCTYAGAGHPPPLVRSPEGFVHHLESQNIPLGVSERNHRFTAGQTVLPPDAVLVFYTDGITEASRDVIEGERVLREAIAGFDFRSSADPARDLYTQILPAHSRDDVALLVVEISAQQRVRRWRFDPIWRDAAMRVRSEVHEELVDSGFCADAIDTFDMLFSEILSNSMRYAPGTIELFLERKGESVIVHVLDKGPGFDFSPRLPRDIFSESGRGLFLLSNFAHEFTVERKPECGSHIRIVLHPRQEELI